MGVFSHKEAIQVSWANDFNRRANVVTRHSQDRTFGGGNRLVETAWKVEKAGVW